MDVGCTEVADADLVRMIERRSRQGEVDPDEHEEQPRSWWTFNGRNSMPDIYLRRGSHWRKAQRRLPEPPNPPEPPRRERGARTLDSLLSGKRRRAPWK